MSTASFTDLIALSTPAVGDVLAITDISDTTQSPSGSTKQITLANLFVRGTVTTSQPIMAATQTWNAGGVTFAGVSVAISNTASAAASLPFQVLGGAAGATNLFSVRIDGLVTTAAGITAAGTVTTTGLIHTDTALSIGAALTPSSGNMGWNETGVRTWQLGYAASSGKLSLTSGDSLGTFAIGTGIAFTVAGNVTLSGTVNSVGTITTGIWNGTAIAAVYGGTAQTTWTTGDLLYASGANTLAKRAIGSTGDVLTVSGGVPTWAALGSLTFTSLTLTSTLTMAATQQLYLSASADGNYLVATHTAGPVDTVTVEVGGSPAVVVTRNGTNFVAITGNVSVSAAASTNSGTILSIGGTQQTTVGAAGGASALPATPLGYLKFAVGLTNIAVPYYAQS